MKKLFFMLGALSLMTLSCSRNDESVHEDSHEHQHAHWDYENPDWAKQGHSECAGLVQSPIDIITTSTIKAELPEIQMQYNEFPVKIIDNGHTVQVNAANSNITYKGETYELKQFHYHAHSEHLVDGKKHPMEVHFVHQNPNTGALIVLGVFVQGGAATDNAEFAKYLNFPTEKNKEVTLKDMINPTNMFPSSKKYYNYTGSLTTPPCSQGLNWVVFKEVVSISDAQLAKFTKKYDHNARPSQKIGSRVVFESK